jgi:hypothetical protein
VLVAIGVITSWLVEPIMEADGQSVHAGSGNEKKTSALVSILQQVLIFRLLRILRLARALRLVVYFETLGKLVHGMMNSVNTMASAFAIMSLVIYILACMGAELITKSLDLREDPQVGPLIEERFDSIPNIVMTLMQFITQDSISTIYVPIIKCKPILALYFLICILVVSVLLVNLVAAIVIEEALSRANKDREHEAASMRHKLKALRPFLKEAFQAMDKSDDGFIQLSEVKFGIGKLNDKIPRELEQVLQPDLLVDLFERLDVDGSGMIDFDEFADGVGHLALMAVPLEITQIIQLLRSERADVAALRTTLEATLPLEVQLPPPRSAHLCACGPQPVANGIRGVQSAREAEDDLQERERAHGIFFEDASSELKPALGGGRGEALSTVSPTSRSSMCC